MARKNRIIIPCRFAYLNCWRPVSVYGGQKYSLLALIPKADRETIEAIQNVNVKGYPFSAESKGNGSTWQLLQRMNSCGVIISYIFAVRVNKFSEN